MDQDNPIVKDYLFALLSATGRANYALRKERHPNPLAHFGLKVFSQSDEDGITLEIVRRLGLVRGTFLEFGAGEGTQNNTLILVSLGWRGTWIDAEPCAVELPGRSRVNHRQGWVTRENVTEMADQARREGGTDQINVISMDLDGNDFYFVEELLTAGFRPNLFIVETFPLPPPIEFKIDYEPDFAWDMNNAEYVGASLATFNKLFGRFDYRLVCCNTGTGANAFFVREQHAEKFLDVPTDIAKIFAAPDWDTVYPTALTPPISRRFVQHIATRDL